MRAHLLLAAGLVLAGLSGSQARSINKEDIWDPSHIGSLPAEVRSYVATLCKGPARAQRDFATYNPREHRWRINIEYLRCEGLAHDFRHGRECLDVDFISDGGSYRMARKNFAACGY
jgi:hypothetical protein